MVVARVSNGDFNYIVIHIVSVSSYPIITVEVYDLVSYVNINHLDVVIDLVYTNYCVVSVVIMVD